MDYLFGKRKTPQELMREYKRTITRSIRDLERERTGLMRQEQRIIQDMKKTAKAGQMDAVKVMARDLIRTRNHIDKFYRMKTQLQAVSLKITTLKSNAAMGQAMHGVTKAMRAMNNQLNMPAMQRIMMEFEKQSEVMEMKGEMMDDTIDDMMDDEETEEEQADGLVQQVLDEIGINLSQQLPTAAVAETPAATKTATKQAVAQGATGGSSQAGPVSTSTADAGGGQAESESPKPSGGGDESDLVARLDALKKR